MGTAIRGVITQSDTDGGLQGYSWAAETDQAAEVMQSDDFDIFQPYGFSALIPKDVEYAGLDTDAGPAAVGVRVECPVTLATGESAHWFDKDVYALAKSGEYEIKAALTKIHDGGAVDFVALAQKVLDELGKIETAFNAHTHPTAPNGPVSGPSLTYTKASVAATKVKAE